MWYSYMIAFFILLIDQISKWMIVANLQLGQKISVISNFFFITSHRNTGAAFSILENQRWFLIVITIIVVMGLVWYIQKIRHQSGIMLPLGLSFILGGAMGNFIDRLLTGEVVDFLQFNFGSYTFPIFNAADMAICVGVGFVLLDAFIAIKRENHHDALSEHNEDSTNETQGR